MNRSPLRGPGEIAEDEAGEALAATYERLREALGVSFVPTVYRMLAVHEPYLSAATDALADLLASDRAEQFAAEARARARHGAAELPASPGIPLGPAKGDVGSILERYGRANPRNLLFAQALLPSAPTGLGDVIGAPSTPPPDTDQPETILADILETHGGFVLPGMWRELAAWPRLLGQLWSTVRAVTDVAQFQRARFSIVEPARAATDDVTSPDPTALGLGTEEVDEIERILDWFVQVITAMIVEIEYLTLMVRD